jgi:son of sevenless-like protein
MVALELMTGQPPYSNTPRDITVLRELDQGKIPDHPGRAATLRGLSDGLWSFMRKCWHKRPDSRPLAAAANCRLRQLRGIGMPDTISSFGSNPSKDCPLYRKRLFSSLVLPLQTGPAPAPILLSVPYHLGPHYCLLLSYILR